MRTITKRVLQGAFAMTLTLGGVTATSGTAQAYGNIDSWIANDQLGYWLGGNNYTGRCVDDSFDSSHADGNLLRGFPCLQNSYSGGWQQWKVIALANGYAQLQNVATNLCLDDSTRSDGSDYLRGFPCYANSFNGGWQGWRIVNRTTASGYYEQVLQNGSTGRCLDDSNAGTNGSDLLRAFPCNGPSQDAGYQGWDIWQ